MIKEGKEVSNHGKYTAERERKCWKSRYSVEELRERRRKGCVDRGEEEEMEKKVIRLRREAELQEIDAPMF